MEEQTRRLWQLQDRHPGDRRRLFSAVGEHVGPVGSVLYPGSFVDIAPSFVFPSVTYLDMDARAPRFFSDLEGVLSIVADQGGSPDAEVAFIHGDYTGALGLEDESFDLLVSLYAGLISDHCTRYLRRGGWLLVNPSHGDAAIAALDQRYRLSGAVLSRSGAYRVSTDSLDEYLIPKKPQEVTSDRIRELGRGIAYTKPAFAYLFTRVK